MNCTARRFATVPALTLGFALLVQHPAAAADWPMWGGTPARNMVSDEKGLPTTADLGSAKDSPDTADPAKMKNVRWVAKIGTQSYGNATVAGGHVYVGTNNGVPHNPNIKGDFGVLLCLDEATGKFLWQLASPKLTAGNASDYAEVGLCCSPTVDLSADGKGCVYIVSNRCEVICVDAGGMGAVNKGPFTDEGQYIAGAGKTPVAIGPGDADIIWRYDMRNELGVFPHEMTSSSVLLAGDRLYVTTSNGVDWTNKHVPSPNAPALICLDKKTGKLLGQERLGISGRTFYCNWSSPSFGNVGGKPTVVFGGGDGFCYGFDPEPVDGTLKELWRIDCNPAQRRVKEGKTLKYGDPSGPSEILGTPVIFEGRAYVAVGQDPEHGDGPGCLTCITGGDKGAVAWQNTDVGRTMSTAAIADGLLYIPDSSGKLFCVDIKTGKTAWTHDLEAHIWGSALLADGKLYIGNENGELTILAAGPTKKELGKIDFGQPVYSTAVAANGVLYVATGQTLFAVKQ